MDLAVVLALAPVAIPLTAALAVLIRVDSPGAVIFKQRRIRSVRVQQGNDWAWELRPFTFYKLRTMHDAVDSSTHREYLAAYITADQDEMLRLQPDRPDNSYKMAGDKRITRVGAKLRELSLDELPQLWNVAKGEMTMVGPRPPIDYELENYSEHDKQRLGGPLGITGSWQVNGRSELTFQEMVELDTEYLEEQSTVLDLKIMVRTIGAVFSRQGAG